MLRMPETVKVGAHTYTVLRKTRREMPKLDGDYLDGCCDYTKLHIYLRKGLRRSKAKEYLLHEVLHACGYPALNDKTLPEEEFVDKISPTLLQVLKENSQLALFLCERG